MRWLRLMLRAQNQSIPVKAVTVKGTVKGVTQSKGSCNHVNASLQDLTPWSTSRPTGPARALLKIVASNPKAIEALHT